MAAQTAASGSSFYNRWLGRHVDFAAGANQDAALGWEFDLGTTLQWDDFLKVDFDMGLYLPGAFYKFSNKATENATAPVFATVLKAGLEF
jgi:hypothetical protein